VYYEKQYYSSVTASNYDVQVVLPEGYKEISSESHLVGYYNKRQNKLFIAFNDEHGKKINSSNTAKDSNKKH
jgi:hypothetical protein